MKQINFKKILELFKRTVNDFLDDNAMKFSASLSYYTVFALPPLSILIISISSFFFEKKEVSEEFYGQLNELIGANASEQIEQAMNNVNLYNSGTIATIIGVVVLLFSASAVFAEIQSSINYIWGFKAKPNKGLIRFVKNRLLSFSMVVSVGFILLVSLMINSVVEVLYDQLGFFFKEETIYLVSVVNNIVVFVIISLLFFIIFKTLPDGKIGWRETLAGACFTAVMFMVGKFGIGLYLGTTASSSLYGAAGSLTVILLWVYYSAMILYFGAEFTKVYAEMYGKKIEPNEYSVLIKKDIIEIE